MVQEPLVPEAAARVADARHCAVSTSVAGSAFRQLCRTRSWVAELSSTGPASGYGTGATGGCRK